MKAKFKLGKAQYKQRKFSEKKLDFFQQVSPSYQCTQMHIKNCFFLIKKHQLCRVDAELVILNPQGWFYVVCFFYINCYAFKKVQNTFFSRLPDCLLAFSY